MANEEDISKSFQELLEDEEKVNLPSPTEHSPQELVEASDDTLAEAFESTITSLAPTIMERKILEGFLKGQTIPQISLRLAVPQSHIRTYLRKPKVKEYLNEVREAVNELDQMMLTDTLRGMVKARIDETLDDEGNHDLALLSKKDSLDIIKVFADITNNISKNKREEKSENVFVNIYNQIID